MTHQSTKGVDRSIVTSRQSRVVHMAQEKQHKKVEKRAETSRMFTATKKCKPPHHRRETRCDGAQGPVYRTRLPRHKQRRGTGRRQAQANGGREPNTSVHFVRGHSLLLSQPLPATWWSQSCRRWLHLLPEDDEVRFWCAGWPWRDRYGEMQVRCNASDVGWSTHFGRNPFKATLLPGLRTSLQLWVLPWWEFTSSGGWEKKIKKIMNIDLWWIKIIINIFHLACRPIQNSRGHSHVDMDYGVIINWLIWLLTNEIPHLRTGGHTNSHRKPTRLVVLFLRQIISPQWR